MKSATALIVVDDGGDVNDLAHMLLHGGEYW
jgi:hypothetical protein